MCVCVYTCVHTQVGGEWSIILCVCLFIYAWHRHGTKGKNFSFEDLSRSSWQTLEHYHRTVPYEGPFVKLSWVKIQNRLFLCWIIFLEKGSGKADLDVEEADVGNFTADIRSWASDRDKWVKSEVSRCHPLRLFWTWLYQQKGNTIRDEWMKQYITGNRKWSAERKKVKWSQSTFIEWNKQRQAQKVPDAEAETNKQN